MAKFVLISGCSSGGKSTLLGALEASGHQTIAEPGRRVVVNQMTKGGTALPWIDMASFARRTAELARSDLLLARSLADLVFFDRGLIDAAVALKHSADVPIQDTLEGSPRYVSPVFLARPWPEIFVRDRARRHGFDDAVREYERLETALIRLRYDVLYLPKADVETRVRFVLAALA